jgi:hypothetical protein
MAFDFKGAALVFNFDNEEAANHFKSWLCESGEQAYWDWMEYREQEGKGPITGTSFNYHVLDGSIIEVTCGRLDGQEE